MDMVEGERAMTEFKKTIFTIKDSGQRRDFNTGAKRDIDDDKPRYDLIPPTALRRVAIHYGNGAKKYDEHNWVKGIPVSRCIGSLLRHVFQFIAGETDEDHGAAIIFNVMCIMHYQEVGRTDLDDRFNWQTGKPNNATD